MICKRFVSNSAILRLPRTVKVYQESTTDVFSGGLEKDESFGKIVYDKDFVRTVDPRNDDVPKKPNKTVEDVFKTTRRLRAKFLANTTELPGEKVTHPEGEEDFFGISSRQLVNNMKNDGPLSQYFESDEDAVLSEEYKIDKTVRPPIDYQKVARRRPEKDLKSSEDIKKVNKGEVEKETYAFEVAMEIRKQIEGKNRKSKDSKGFRTMTSVTPDWNSMTDFEIFKVLRKAVVYNTDDILAINKPYGLACQSDVKSHVVISAYFDKFADWLERSQRGNNNSESDKEDTWLRIVHRLDRDTTGVLLLATKKAVAAKLRFWFNERKVLKSYLAITKFVPRQEEGIIDIPMYEFEISRNRYRMNLIPAAEASSRKGVVKAVTKYKVLDYNGSSCALLELSPETGVKHQLRCHLGLGLDTPVLGDHKYSYAGSIKPQRLPPSVLQALEVRQAKVRSVPLHLHASRIVLPEFVDGKTVVIGAKPPGYFVDTARRLKLKLPYF